MFGLGNIQPLEKRQNLVMNKLSVVNEISSFGKITVGKFLVETIGILFVDADVFHSINNIKNLQRMYLKDNFQLIQKRMKQRNLMY